MQRCAKGELEFAVAIFSAPRVGPDVAPQLCSSFQKVSIFEVRDKRQVWQWLSLDLATQWGALKLQEPLARGTAHLAAGFDAVCLSADDDAGTEVTVARSLGSSPPASAVPRTPCCRLQVIEALAAGAVRTIALRCPAERSNIDGVAATKLGMRVVSFDRPAPHERLCPGQ